MSGTARIVSPEEMFARIAVRDPYYALREVAIAGGGGVEAEVPVEQKSAREAGAITAAEAARHLGIIGMCAAAEVNPRKELHYYVARTATLQRAAPGQTSAVSKLEARAKAQLISKDTAHATASLKQRGGGTLYTL